jgi:Predicted sulfurtransferase
MDIINIAAYQFAGIPEPTSWLDFLQNRCQQLSLKGTIVLATEGINLSMAGKRENVDTFVEFLRSDPFFEGRFANIEIKESPSYNRPFRYMRVRVAKEIITMRHPMNVTPEAIRAPIVEPAKLKEWIDKGCDDDGREIVLLDTRNDYEVDVGTFENALDLRIEKFSEFPGAFNTALGADESLQNKTFVSFCTGGIRCEKAALFMQEVGVPRVFQLNGGILKYFEEVGGAHWNGECFVFDERVAVDPELKQSTNDYGVKYRPHAD